MLTIKNIHKIWGRQLQSAKWAGSFGWAVMSVKMVGDTYIFELVSNGKTKLNEIQLKREPSKYNPDDKVFLYEMWTWNLNNGGKPEQAFYSKRELGTVDGMALRLGLMLEKVLPND
jgi:hypothetical protein